MISPFLYNTFQQAAQTGQTSPLNFLSLLRERMSPQQAPVQQQWQAPGTLPPHLAQFLSRYRDQAPPPSQQMQGPPLPLLQRIGRA